MADDADSDMLMFLVTKDSATPIAAESQLNVVGSERLMEGFSAGKFFEVENFSLSFELLDDEGGEELNDEEKRSYARWRALDPSGTVLKPTPPFRAEPGDVSVSRKIDASSPILLKHCLDSKAFARAVLIKRARIGQRGMMTVVLRMEFNEVWLRAIDWEDGDTVRETCKFKFSKVKVTYAKQQASGMPGPTSEGNWSADGTAAQGGVR